MSDQEELNLLPGNVKAAVAGASSADLWLVEPELIRTHPKLQPRDKNTQAYKDRVRYLADLIKANGYDRGFPLKLYVAREDGQDVLFLVQGHRRLDAVRLAIEEGFKIEKIPCVTTERGTTMEDLLVSTVTGNEGEPLQPIETAAIVRELIGMNMTEPEIARRLGYSKTHISNLLSMLEAPRDVREMIQGGQVAASVAIQTVKDHGKEAAKVLQAGLEVAKAKGKDKVTPKHIKAAGMDKPKTPKAKGPETEPQESGAPTAQDSAPENTAGDEQPQLPATPQAAGGGTAPKPDINMAVGMAVLNACKIQVEKGRPLSNLNLQTIVERAVRNHAANAAQDSQE